MHYPEKEKGDDNEVVHCPFWMGCISWKDEACDKYFEPKESTWICDCKDSAIRWVDRSRPHPAITREGWFCMGCLTQYAKDSILTDVQIERNTWRTKAFDLKEHVRSLSAVIGIAQNEIAGLRELLAASESLAEEYRQCALSSLHNAGRLASADGNLNQRNQMTDTNKTDNTTDGGLHPMTCSPKIFRVEVAYEIYVVAESQIEALLYAKDGVDDEEPEMEHATQIKDISEIPEVWRDCLPYGPREIIKRERTIRDFMPNARAMPPAKDQANEK